MDDSVWKWIKMEMRERKLTKVDERGKQGDKRGGKWTKMEKGSKNGCKYIKVDANEWTMMKGDENGWKWMKVEERG